MKLALRTGLSAWVAGALTSVALATPTIDSARVNTRLFNDDPASTLTVTNLYPAIISMHDVGTPVGGFANRHNFRLSDNGGISDAVFLNGDGFSFGADVTLTGDAEGGLNVSPWWSQQIDGNFMINARTGEIACFGGRLPFYSFTGNHGRTYTSGTTVHMSVDYRPNSLSALDPGTIQYHYTDGSGTYSSPAIALDMGNPAEDPPYGLWGLLNDGRVGGYFQAYVNPIHDATIVWGNISFVPEPSSIALLSLLGLAALRRR